ncbi:hypothetical protein SCLCIDRAFT_1218729 [Scleroderma citrinum Foug A]|uniref:Uncharacterized protein n=1 Tax=Scleroderma citrinum Foug A TaxID=1036808 RepID=A0A0C3DQ98_9AGAM|nr:hypothetical protein SCLCIDRAFT_1218729 [Scleroderma citrinum Foug A]
MWMGKILSFEDIASDVYGQDNARFYIASCTRYPVTDRPCLSRISDAEFNDRWMW